jgi:hypothetical protein
MHPITYECAPRYVSTPIGFHRTIQRWVPSTLLNSPKASYLLCHSPINISRRNKDILGLRVPVDVTPGRLHVPANRLWKDTAYLISKQTRSNITSAVQLIPSRDVVKDFILFRLSVVHILSVLVVVLTLQVHSATHMSTWIFCIKG